MFLGGAQSATLMLMALSSSLQLLKAETDKTLTLVSTALPNGRRMQSPLVSQQELELSLQIHSMATRLRVSVAGPAASRS